MFLLTDRTHRMLLRHDPDIGHIFVPNQRARIPGEAGGYIVATNGKGFRSNWEYQEKRGTRPRILMFGDSYTAGDDVCNEDRYSDRLGELLDAEVQNYAIPGSGTDQHLLAYEKFAKSVEADLVIVCVQIDSFHRIQVAHRPTIDRSTGRTLLVPKPYFELVNGELIIRHTPVSITRNEAADSCLPTNGKSEAAWYRHLIRLYQRAPFLRETLHSEALEDVTAQLVNDLHRALKIQPYPDIRSSDSVGWKLMKAILERFVAKTKPVPILIVPIPTKEFYLRGVPPMYQELFASLNDPPHGVHVADVSTPLGGLPWNTRKQLHFEIGSHFTPLAHRLVSEELARFISSRDLLKQRARPLVPSQRPSPVQGIAPRQQKAICILGISCFYHNSAASLIRDGEIVAAAEEERFTRLKNDRRFPHQAVNYCLEEARTDVNDLSAVVYYDDPAITFERICHSLMAVDRASARHMWAQVMPSWLRTMLRTPQLIKKYLHYNGSVLRGVHHRSHAASCFFASPFDRAAVLTVDGVGEWATASIGAGNGSDLRLLKEMRFPHSVGLLYSAFTYFTGFKVNSGEYKMMGLAPYGAPKYVETIYKHLLDLKDDGSIELNLSYFEFLKSQQMTNGAFAKLFDGPNREPEARITRREMDIARSIQVVTEEILLRMARTAKKLTGEKHLCFAGGVALNCVANGRLLREGPFEDIWVQPAAGDSGCALGAALDVYHTYFGQPRKMRGGQSLQHGSYLGPEFGDEEIRSFLETSGLPHRYLSGQERSDFLADHLAQGEIVGHFSGRLEYGPRSLGARSILGDPRNPTMQSDLNLRIKYRESFRPFAPAVLAESASTYFELDRDSPYMLLVAPVKEDHRLPPVADGGIAEDDDLLPIVKQLRSDIPAVTHVDYSARVQTVRREEHAEFYDLIEAFRRKTGCAVLVNTSFNVRGEPIVCTPLDAHRCFARTNMDVLALGNFILLKSEQPASSLSSGSHLEDEDPEETAPSHPPTFLESIDKLFLSNFWPAAEKLRLNKEVRITNSFGHTWSTWANVGESGRLRRSFEFPPSFHEEKPSPRPFVRELTQGWSGGVARELAPVLELLVAEALRHPLEADLDSSVSDSVYVMF